MMKWLFHSRKQSRRQSRDKEGNVTCFGDVIIRQTHIPKRSVWIRFGFSLKWRSQEKYWRYMFSFTDKIDLWFHLHLLGFHFWNISLCNLECSQTLDPPAPVAQVMELRACHHNQCEHIKQGTLQEFGLRPFTGCANFSLYPSNFNVCVPEENSRKTFYSKSNMPYMSL